VIHPGYAFGADLSFLKQVGDRGVRFKDAGVEKPGLQIFRDHGYNWIRRRLCVEPVKFGLPNDLAYTLAMARAARQLGYKFLLTFHWKSGRYFKDSTPPFPETPEGRRRWLEAVNKESAQFQACRGRAILGPPPGFAAGRSQWS
jgi:arabinogalactan endo-1,4-beta-galactosidase